MLLFLANCQSASQKDKNGEKVEKAMINPWQYPPHFDFQYGDWLCDSFEKDIIAPCLGEL
jgi:hypothetical protein